MNQRDTSEIDRTRDLRLRDLGYLGLYLAVVLGGAWFFGLLHGLVAVGVIFLVLGLMAFRLRIAGKDAAANEGSGELVGTAGASRFVPLAAIIDQFPDPILLLDDEGRVIMSNGSTHPFFASATINRHVSGVLRSPRVLEAIEQALGGAGACEVEYSVPVPVERHLLAHVSSIELPPTKSSPAQIGALIVVRDLTAQKRVEQMRADFVANASHELRTPLASLSGFVDTLRGHAREDADARERFLEIMMEQASRMRRLIEDLLSLSRIELNEHVSPETPVRLDEVVRDVVDGLLPQAAQREVVVDLSLPERGCTVLGERDELYQVFQNLIDNALKYGASGGRVEVTLDVVPASAGQSSPMAVAVVRDFGEGIEREHIPRLTERFYRVDVQRSREKGGTGLGLAIVKHIVNRHRGSLSIESRKGQGSSFSVLLPQSGAGISNDQEEPREVGRVTPPAA